ncbi:glycosyltransferase [Brevibacterium litoralis]|uniref:glycosyltransferase n=1 Tax=Brevibacterium litoralis TaxID=3138935 RepID=UPI0032F0140B
MKSKKALLITGCALVLLVLLVVAAFTFDYDVAVWVVLGILQLGVIILLLDTRRTLSSRLYAVSRKLERKIGAKGSTGSATAMGTGKSSALAGGSEKVQAGSGRQSAPAVMVREADVRAILRSRILDLEWYEAVTGREFPDARSAVEHYLAEGRVAGRTLHPLFDPDWVAVNWSTANIDPLLKYVRNEYSTWSKPTSALFDPDLVEPALPENESGPLASFLLNRGNDAPLPYESATMGIAEGLTYNQVRPAYLELAVRWAERARTLAPSRGEETPPSVDPALEQTLAEFDTSSERPQVSIVLPTWNRAGTLRAAIDSVRAQSYENWQLVVADDGSIDDTEHILAAETARDDRIQYLKLDHRGVSAARNSALDAATGEYIAFLDSDKVWDPEFLRTMIGHLTVTGVDAAYSMVAVDFEGSTVYRSVPATHETLLASNSIDQTAIVSKKSVLDEIGGFDEHLRRAVDYDLVLNLSGRTELVQVPFVGVRYSEDDQDPNRISESQSVAWNYHVRDKHLWNAHTPREIVPGRVTVIVDGVESAREAGDVIHDVVTHAGDADIEVILVAASDDRRAARSLVPATFGTVPVRVVPAPAGGSRPLYLNQAIRAAQGEYLVLQSAGHRWETGDLTGLISRLDDTGAAAVHPLVLDGTRLIHDAGAIYSDHTPDPVPFLRGLHPDSPDWTTDHGPVPGAPFPLVVRTEEVLALRGFTTKLKDLWADIDLSQKIARSTAKPVVLDHSVRATLMKTGSFSRKPEREADVHMYRELWETPPAGTSTAFDLARVDAVFEGASSVSAPAEPSRWTTARWTFRTLESVQENLPQLRWALKTAAPANDNAASWGDWHFGQSLAAALRRLGQHAVVEYGPNAGRDSAHLDDVVLTLRGLDRVPLPTATTNLMWVISHPDEVSAREMAAYDQVYAASTSWPDIVRSQWGIDVTPMLQCTDPERFYIDDPVEEVRHKLLMVGNSRKQYRPAAWHTAKAGLPVTVYGKDWEGLVPDSAIAGEYVPNETLRRYYRGATWALNDHWADMREHGFISNRIFDILASGGRLLTDDVTGIDGLFPADVLPHGPAVFRSPADLLLLAEAGPERYYDEATLGAVSAHVRESHSFDARARVLVEDALRLRGATVG